jgi:hypothetical protein
MRNTIFFIIAIVKEFLISLINPIRRQLSIKAFRLTRSAAVDSYCAYNKSNLASGGDYKNGYILVDCFPVPQWIMVNSIFLDRLREITGAGIASYGINDRDAYEDKLYKSFGANIHFNLRLSLKQEKERLFLFLSILKSIKSKEDVFNIQIENVSIGIEIYESILRLGCATVPVMPFKSAFQIFSALRYFIFFRDMFVQDKIKAVVLSHDVYIHMGILSKLANHNSVPVFHANVLEIIQTDIPHKIHDRFVRYPEYFRTLSKAEQEKGLELAKNAINKRLQGIVGVNMSYQIASAFENKKIVRQTSENNKTKICVATHCFYDNPHAYGGLLFIDFYEWLIFLGEISKETDYEWYLKPHRDYLPGTLEILQEIATKYPAFTVINPDTSFHQLRDEGVSVALTCYGSIGHELPLLGFNVINAGYNPHIAYGFNIHCKTKEEYKDILLHLDQLPPVSDIESLPEFFYVHNYMNHQDDYFFNSYQEFLKAVDNNVLSEKCYEYFLEDADKYVLRYRKKIDSIIETNYRYSSELAILSNSSNSNFKPIEISNPFKKFAGVNKTVFPVNEN